MEGGWTSGVLFECAGVVCGGREGRGRREIGRQREMGALGPGGGKNDWPVGEERR